MITLKIGRLTLEVADFAAASKAYTDHNTLNDLGMRNSMPCTFKHEGKQYYVSNNGKVWQGHYKKWTPEMPCVYNPYA